MRGKQIYIVAVLFLLLIFTTSCSKSTEESDIAIYSNKIEKYLSNLSTRTEYFKIIEIKGIKTDNMYYLYFKYEFSFQTGSEIFIRDGIGVFDGEHRNDIYRYVDRSLHENIFKEFEDNTANKSFEYIERNIIIKE
ncbi:MAG: hypothetical protein KKH01_00480 [Firmicutes bacterium]|nr:hypothetical protein [Bacillota bacterium]